MKLILNGIYFKIGVLAAATVICALPLFVKIGAPPIYMWDEATYANNALDMYLSNDPVVVRMEGQPDLYNTKPPFVLWMQTISLHLFGWNELAIRMPSAIFATLTLCLLMWFGVVVLESVLVAVVAMFTLAGTNGFVAIHVSRSGDLDATLVWWITLYTLIFLKFLLKPGKPGLHFFLIAVGLSGAFLTKGIAGWFFLPWMVAVSLLHGSFLKLLRQKEVYWAGTSVLAVAAGYYLLRENMAPGYWSVVYHSEILRFNNSVMSWHVQPFSFYFQNMLQERFTPFIFLLPFTLLVFLLDRDRAIRHCLLYLWILCLGFFLLISYPADKLEWYDAPLYPLLSLIIAIFCRSMSRLAIQIPFLKTNQMLTGSLIALLLLVFFAFPYRNVMKRVMQDDNITYPWDHTQLDEFRITGAFMKFLKENNPELKAYTILKSPPANPEHEDQLKFYKRIYEEKDQFDIILKNQVQDLKPGELVLTCEKPMMDSIQVHWTTASVQTWKGCRLDSIETSKSKSYPSSPDIQ